MSIMNKLTASTLFISLCLAAPVMAQGQTNATQKPAPKSGQAHSQTEPPAPANKTASKPAQQQDSFTSSEKIRADTVVDFPADI